MIETWTPERVKSLEALWDQGLSASRIGMALDVSKNAVIGKAHRLKLPSRPSPVKAEPVKVAPPPAPEAREEVSDSKKTSLLDLTEQTCKWPIGHPGDADFYFCGKPSRPGVPYCPDHCLMAFQAQLPRKNRPGGKI